MNAPTRELLKQHLIDPEICIRCNTCEETCPVDAVTHDDNNYVVDAAICNFCMDCISPCPTGSIDNWRVVATPYSLDEQFSWNELPAQEETAKPAMPGRRRSARGRDRRAARGGAQGPRRQAGRAAFGQQADGQSLQPQQAGDRDRHRQLPPDRGGRRFRRAPHHPGFRRPAVPGAGRPEHRHRPAGHRRRRQAASDPALFRCERRATARSRTPTISRLTVKREAGAASARTICAICRAAPRSRSPGRSARPS